MKEADVSNFETRIPVVFHVIHDGEKYRVSEQRIKQQVDVLNADFFAADISFYPKRIAYHDNKSWCRLVPSTFAVRLGVPDVEAQMKAQLGETPAEALNVYIVSPRIDDLLGWARFPWDLAITPQQDGVVLAHHTLPGNPADRSQLGRTATHEVGHWLGLLHTFQNGCSEPGDGIHDTPFRAGPSYQCPPRPSLCAPTGDNHERIANFMDYLGDACATAFTAGQIERMKAMIRLFRPKLLANLQNSPRAQSRGSGGRPSTNVDRLNAIMAD
jgi:hypothetical protein